MHKLTKKALGLTPWLGKVWVQWLLAAILFFSISWLYMGSAITSCSTSTVALNSDSSGGIAWFQWASNNSMSWGHTDASNFPSGESLARPQFITSTIALFIYRLFSVISTPICGLNMIVLIGYMSSALLMFGLVRWLIKRFDIALFAGYAAGFVPYHQLKAQTHIFYMYGSIFIASIWAYLWFIKSPSYKRAILLGSVNAIGFYFDGYFVLISGVTIAVLYSSSILIDFLSQVRSRQFGKFSKETIDKYKYMMLSIVLLGLLLVPILYVQQTQGDALKKSLAASRTSIKDETVSYAARPAEFFLPSYNNPFMPEKYQSWRLAHQHESNPSENTLFVGYTIFIFAAVAMVALFFKKIRESKYNSLEYVQIASIIGLVLAICTWFSMPSKYTLFGHVFYSPSRLLIEFTSNWRVMARFFLVIHPLLVILSGFGLYFVSKSWKAIWRIAFVLLCSIVLFLEYLPGSFNPTADLYKDSPEIYLHLSNDPSVKAIAEYPVTGFLNAPTIFTFQEVHKKKLLNSSDSVFSRGPFDMAIAGLSDIQTIGTLKTLGIDVVTSYDLPSSNPGFSEYTVPSANNKMSIPTIYSYRINSSVKGLGSVLLAESGFDNFVIDGQQLSHRTLINKGTMKVQSLTNNTRSATYDAGFYAQSLCSEAGLTISQSGSRIWSGRISAAISSLSFMATNKEDLTLEATCPLDIVNMHSEEIIR